MRRLSFLILFIPLCALGQSPHGKELRRDCSECHQPSTWQISRATMSFRHEATRFPLTGQHKNIACKQCHATLVFSAAKPECQSCHRDVHLNTVGTDCNRCHSPQTWVVANPNNLHQASRFPLVGAHAKADCKQCHSEYRTLNFRILGTACFDCHLPDYRSAKNPDHLAAGFSKECQSCHTISAASWRASGFEHGFFPLNGKHNIANCYACHKPGGFTGLNQQCVSCHQGNYSATLNPNHISLQLSTQCQTCHSINGWKPASFNHTQTGFTLSGKHLTAACSQCHTNGAQKPPTNCYACHKSDYDNTTNPRHSSAGFPTTCSNCHSTAGWSGAQFDHDASFFPIYSGKHKTAWNACSSCHTNSGNYALFSCTNCHEHSQQTMQTKHAQVNGYLYESNACLACHPRGSAAGSFNHQSSAFPLTGAHSTTACAGCHVNGYTTKPTTLCKICHDNKRQQAVNPNHLNTTFPVECQQCHNTTAWKPSSFNHQTGTQFVLTGKHVTASCNKCHQAQFAGTTKECYPCHQGVLSTPVNPNHTVGNFPKVCSQCHATTAWLPSSFDHQVQTQYTLTGNHLTASCNKCHQTAYAGATKICKDCHLTNYQQSQNPNHALANFTQPCEQCHTTAGWKPSSYNHSITGYTLTGKHAPVACNKCHTTTYTGTSQVCYSCHQTHFAQAVNPRHYTPGFSTVCTACHSSSITGWSGVNYPGHDAPYFPVYSGKHRNTWTTCAQCHPNAANYAAFTCISCHEHNQQEMAQKHQNVSGYSYVSSECYRCHPQGNNLQKFSHLLFPLSVRHNALDCADCHTTGKNRPQCISCHLEEFQLGHQRRGPSLCYLCHNNNSFRLNRGTAPKERRD